MHEHMAPEGEPKGASVLPSPMREAFLEAPSTQIEPLKEPSFMNPSLNLDYPSSKIKEPVEGALMVEARKMEHQYPHALKVEKRGS